MKHNFDEVVPRRNSNCFKWDHDIYAKDKMLPMWVADMDFLSPPEIIDALQDRIKHGVFGYTFPSESLVNTIIERLEKSYNWNIEKEWIVWLPGLVTGFNVACRAIGNPGDEVATSVPVYYPFLSAPENNNKKLYSIPLVSKKNRWTMDFSALDTAITPKTSLYLLCNPHNPGGTVYSKEELLHLAEICKKNNAFICSDEIHCDLILTEKQKHIPIASLSEEIANRTITLMAPSKTFNIAGLGCSYAIIPNKELRSKYTKAMEGLVPHVNLLGYTAAYAAYKYGNDWLSGLIEYLRDNLKLITEFVDKTPGLTMNQHDSTYLAWIDARGLNLDNPAKYFEKYNVGLSDGTSFGAPGFIRMNFGCPRSLVIEALRRIETAIKEI